MSTEYRFYSSSRRDGISASRRNPVEECGTNEASSFLLVRWCDSPSRFTQRFASWNKYTNAIVVFVLCLETQ